MFAKEGLVKMELWNIYTSAEKVFDFKKLLYHSCIFKHWNKFKFAMMIDYNHYLIANGTLDVQNLRNGFAPEIGMLTVARYSVQCDDNIPKKELEPGAIITLAAVNLSTGNILNEYKRGISLGHGKPLLMHYGPGVLKCTMKKYEGDTTSFLI